MIETATKYKVGDELAFNCGSHTRYWRIEKITKITPSGRMTVGEFSVNPDLTVRGRSGSRSSPYAAEPVTNEIREEIKDTEERSRNYSVVTRHNWRNTSSEALRRVADILRELQS